MMNLIVAMEGNHPEVRREPEQANQKGDTE
jgi:hypothetical protein